MICGAALLFLGIAFYISYRKQKGDTTLCPYTGNPLRYAMDLHYTARVKTMRYLYNLKEFDNQMFDFEKAAYCRETGRIFKDCVDWFGTIKVDWNFIKKMHPGDYVSWGSLTEEQKLLILQRHDSLEGFQVEESSPSPSPRSGLKIYTLQKPGPLYVDYETGILIGWKEVPETDVEVLVVQKPKKRYMPQWKEKPYEEE